MDVEPKQSVLDVPGVSETIILRLISGARQLSPPLLQDKVSLLLPETGSLRAHDPVGRVLTVRNPQLVASHG